MRCDDQPSDRRDRGPRCWVSGSARPLGSASHHGRPTCHARTRRRLCDPLPDSGRYAAPHRRRDGRTGRRHRVGGQLCGLWPDAQTPPVGPAGAGGGSAQPRAAADNLWQQPSARYPRYVRAHCSAGDARPLSCHALSWTLRSASPGHRAHHRPGAVASASGRHAGVASAGAAAGRHPGPGDGVDRRPGRTVGEPRPDGRARLGRKRPTRLHSEPVP